MKPTGRVVDQIVVTPMESVWLVHEGHAASSEPEATFALVQRLLEAAHQELPRRS